jgi:hypothetical protein
MPTMAVAAVMPAATTNLVLVVCFMAGPYEVVPEARLNAVRAA